MSFIVSRQESTYEPIPEGTYFATCYLLANVGKQYNKTFDKWSEKMVIGWEIEGETVTKDGVEVPRTIHGFYTKSLHEKSELCKTLENWRGKKFTAEELKGFDIRHILGAGCQIQILHKQKDNGNIGEQIAGIMALPKGYKPTPPTQKITFDIETDIDKLPQMPKVVQSMVEKSSAVESSQGAEKLPFDEPVFDEHPFGEESDNFPFDA